VKEIVPHIEVRVYSHVCLTQGHKGRNMQDS
jgi:hypothetical protein